MKKKFLTIVIALTLAFSTLALSGCASEIEPISATKFAKAANKADLDYEDITDYSFEGYNLEQAYITGTDDYQIEFYEFDKTKDAREIYGYIKSSLEDEYSGSTSSLSINDTEKYSVKDGDEFVIIERAKNTVVYAYTDEAEDYKDDIKTFLESIGY